MKRTSYLLFLGIGISTLFFLGACSGNATPEIAQVLAPLDGEQEEIASPVQSPDEIVPTPEEIYPAPPVEGLDSESGEEMSYPPPEDQGLNDGYPPPGDQPGGYPPPAAELPTPNPAYPAPGDLPGGSPSPETSDPPPVKVGLEATDPSTVNLASGELQFVEFFAFW